MNTRRDFVRLGIGALLGAAPLLNPFSSAMQRAWAASRRVLSKGTRPDSLIHENPAVLDTINLEITPLQDFGTMGPTALVVDRDRWRLQVSGQVNRALSFTYSQLTALPSLEREVLLICPGFFANHGRWKGVSIKGLLEQAGFDRSAARVVIEAKGGKAARFSSAELLSDKVFLAYQVNGEELPRKHGFPLRVVAEGRYGSDWVKYVDRITVEKE